MVEHASVDIAAPMASGADAHLVSTGPAASTEASPRRPGALSDELETRLCSLQRRLPWARERYPADEDFWTWFRGELSLIQSLPTTPAERAAYQLRIALMIAERPTTAAIPRAAA
ncbi:hypothetical protein [Luteimonas sp. YGD11-2]|uniref:hypothetical protein n=1 Tax=Luteimonas sp. YGD11-2 TaxID=2508168 RepID=UPI00100C1032|nr:hypothetical protein [Luteimonas sp. YGD11-2]